MFRNKTAWFSSCVSETCLYFWTSEGGTLTSWRTADYLFSEDATCPDTLRIFESKDYLVDKVTVFHSLFLSACEKRQSVKSVCIGHYVLPPTSVQDEVRKVVGRLIWEGEGEQSSAQDRNMNSLCLTDDEQAEKEVSRSDFDSSDIDSSDSSEVLVCNHFRNAVNNSFTGYVSMDNLQKYSGDLCDIHRRDFKCSTCKGLICCVEA
ncbi:telomere repeats-binding bouquet formation protein 2 [Cololabis saira]|uniref:telomere repeats-binding bouquet formation protein 2 n=1 Tax=Cololabis saira TaxID=129043 RepID=UPI002AD22E42|nr:telomere repeats-binding bouquet formation protein 2 [Cololabis saira]